MSTRYVTISSEEELKQAWDSGVLISNGSSVYPRNHKWVAAARVFSNDYYYMLDYWRMAQARTAAFIKANPGMYAKEDFAVLVEDE